MRIYRDQLLKRCCGVVIGIGFISVGLYSIFAPMVGMAADAELQTLATNSRDRAFWYGICAVLIGLLAVAVSLTVRELDNIWCRHPRRW